MKVVTLDASMVRSTVVMMALMLDDKRAAKKVGATVVRTDGTMARSMAGRKDAMGSSKAAR